MTPFVMNSASRMGVRRVFSAVGPAPETPGSVDNRVFARIPQNTGFLQGNGGFAERNAIVIIAYICTGTIEDIDYDDSTTI